MLETLEVQVKWLHVSKTHPFYPDLFHKELTDDFKTSFHRHGSVTFSILNEYFCFFIFLTVFLEVLALFINVNFYFAFKLISIFIIRLLLWFNMLIIIF